METILKKVIIPAVGGVIGIAVMIGVQHYLLSLPLMMVPFTTSIVLAMATPDSQYSHPFNIAGGHVLSAVAGFAILWTLGSELWTPAIAVGLAIVLMQASDSMHPPAGINAFIVVTHSTPLSFLFVPVTAGAILLVALAWGYHRLTRPGIYPPKRSR